MPMRLSEIMSAPVTTIRSNASAAEAAVKMQRAHITHLVVLNGAREIAGVVCDHDLRGVEPGSRVEGVMSTPAVTWPASAEVHAAAKLLRRRDIGSILVLAGKRLVGIVTTSDLLALLGKGAVRIQEMTPKWTLPRRGPTHRPER
jgi:CBS domain-containing protein